MNSRAFVPLISAAAIEKRFENLKSASRCDNVLLEYRLSLELQCRGLIEYIFPIFVGSEIVDKDDTVAYSKYYPKPTSSHEIVSAVENKVTHHLMQEGQGLPFLEEMSVISILDAICRHNGDFIMSQTPIDADAVRTKDEIMHDVTERIKKTTERAATVAKAEPDSPVP